MAKAVLMVRCIVARNHKTLVVALIKEVVPATYTCVYQGYPHCMRYDDYVSTLINLRVKRQLHFMHI